MSEWQKILIAVNETETAMRGVRYVGKMMEAMKVGSIHLLHVFPDPAPNFYHEGGTLEEYQKSMGQKGQKVISHAIEILKEFGFKDESIESEVRMAEGKTISQAVLDAREKWDCGTVVVGKRGVCKAEEFLFGSISNTLARDAKEFTTWVVG